MALVLADVRVEPFFGVVLRLASGYCEALSVADARELAKQLREAAAEAEADDLLDDDEDGWFEHDG